MAKKLTTEEILAACRTQGAFGSGGSSESAAPPPTASSGSSTPTPGSTADILAAARAQAAGGAAKPAATGDAPKSTADILAAARAQGSGAANKPTAAAATPGSTADILAAARAQASGGGSAKVKPVAKASPKKVATKKKDGGTRTVAEMLAAARQADGTRAEDKQAAVSKPKLPSKKLSDVKRPAGKSAAAKKEAASTRRGFLTAFNFGWALLGLATTAFGLGVARFMMPNVLVEPPTKFKIGAPGDYPAGTVSTKWKAQRGIWVVNTDYKGDSMIYALLTICTHLGCTPSWLEGEQKFKCPCHGSGFYKTGINFEGPAPRPLERVGLRLAEDGMLEVDKSIKFQEEMGQWEDPSSFYGLV